MPYCAQTDILNLELTEAELIQLTDDNNIDTVDPAKITAAVAKADSEIDAYCQDAYTVPFGPSSEVLGTDGQNYTCILEHTAAAINKPITGANWATYWMRKGSSGGTWVSGTAYTAIPSILIGWSATLAAFNLYRNLSKPATIIDRYNKVMEWLKAISEGKRQLPGVEAESSLPASTTDGTVQEFRKTQRDGNGSVVGNIGTLDTW